MIQSAKEIEDLVSSYFAKHDNLLEFLYSMKRDIHVTFQGRTKPAKIHGSLCVFSTNQDKIHLSHNILPAKDTISNKELNKFLKKFDDKINPKEDYADPDWKIYKYDNSNLLEQNNFWKTLTKDLNHRGYELEVFMVDEMNIPVYRGKNTRYCEFFVGATQNEDLLKQHKGKIGARSIGLLDHRIMNFCDFINEGKETSDDAVIDILRSLSRNYESKKFFYTDLLQFEVEEERRDWRDTRKYVELEKTVTHDATYKLKFKLDEKHYLLSIDFKFSFKGDKEKDAPENASPEELGRLNIVLSGIDLKKIELNSSDMNFSTSTFSELLKKTVTDFLVKMMQVDYDTLGAEIYSLQQK
jgi:hypothetical protein